MTAMRVLFFSALLFIGFAATGSAAPFVVLKGPGCSLQLSWDEAGKITGRINARGKSLPVTGRFGKLQPVAFGDFSWKAPIQLRIGKSRGAIRGTFTQYSADAVSYKFVLQGQITKPEIIERKKKAFRATGKLTVIPGLSVLPGG